MITRTPKQNRIFNHLCRAYRDWLDCGSDMDCGLNLARHIRAPSFAKIETRCIKYAEQLRATGETVPPVPGEKDFK